MAVTPRVVVDGSNIATEGRTTPSLAQLESAVAEFVGERPKMDVTVVVDATFAHRIAAAERKRFEEGQLRGEYVSPPAGAIGRGDAFVLAIAKKANAIVLSNDSFQEFHGEHPWLFEDGRLIGATPVSGVGWIFLPRTPVRGAKSRASVRKVRSAPPPVPTTPPPRPAKKLDADAAVEKKIEPRARPAKRSDVAAVNDPATFIAFIAAHPLGEIIDAEVESFTSHGAVIRYDGVQCYAPLSGLGAPPPRSAREVLTRGEVRPFVVRALDSERRGIELALPPSDDGTSATDGRSTTATPRRSGRRRAARAGAEDVGASHEDAPAKKAPAKKAPARKAPAKKTAKAPAKKAPAKKAPAKKTAKAPAKKAPAKKAAKKTAAPRSATPKATGSRAARTAPASEPAPEDGAQATPPAHAESPATVPEPRRRGGRRASAAHGEEVSSDASTRGEHEVAEAAPRARTRGARGRSRTGAAPAGSEEATS